jgi:hypothetical protein
MTNAFTRGTAPGRERDALQRPGTFKPDHKKVGGRKKGTPNAFSTDYKRAVFATAYFVGRDGMGADGLVGYCQRLLIEAPDVGLMLLARMFLLEDGWPLRDRTLSKEQNNKEVRDLIGANQTGTGTPEPALMTEWPIPDLMRIAVRCPGDFGKLFAAMVPVPRGRRHRPWSDGMTSVERGSVGEESNEWLQLFVRCALRWGQAQRSRAPVEPRAGGSP